MSRIETIGNATLYLGDCLDVLKTLPTNSVDSVVCDPPYGLSFMGKKWDYDVPSVEIWAECLRVLKPGGHLLAFAGTRTQHRMAVRIEDAGFEIRDMIAWIYGSGFPKSLNVAKAVDEHRKPDTRRELLPDEVKFCAWMREQSGLDVETVRSVTGSARFMTGEVEITNTATKEKPRYARRAMVPTADAWSRLLGKMKLQPPEWVEALVKEPPQPPDETPGEAWAKGKGQGTAGSNEWQGWGTALKPALEPITMARKPLATCATNVLDKVESQLRERGVRGEILWKPENASGAARSKKAASSDSTRHLGQSATSAKNADESVTQSVEKQSLKSSGLLGTSGLNQTPDGSASFQGCTTSACANPSSQPTAESAPAAESKSATSSPLTTSTAAELNTGSRSTEKCTPNYGATDSLPDTESFAGIATGLTGSMATVRINRDSQGFFLWPRGLPEFVPGSPLTVAANVLAHGTGAINVDGCRVEGTPAPTRFDPAKHGHEGWRMNATGAECAANASPLGRWPANLILSDDPEVVAAFPDSNGSGPARKLNRSAKPEQQGWGMNTTASDVASLRDAGTGSAARFFMQCKGGYSDAWQDLNLPQENANTAEQGSSQQRQAAVSALVLAVSSALPEGLLCSGLSMAPFTSATANELRLIAETATQTIQTIGSKFWRESKPARLSLSLNHASDAEIQRLTDTTTITVSRWKSDGSAEPVTFSITPMSLEVGGKDCAPSMDGKRFIYCAKASKKDRGGGNGHPTVKPTDLMAYLCRLVTPPGGVVLDPFMGSGSTGKAAIPEGFHFIGVECEPAYFDIARRRIEQAHAQGQLFEPTQAAPVQLGLEAA